MRKHRLPYPCQSLKYSSLGDTVGDFPARMHDEICTCLHTHIGPGPLYIYINLRHEVNAVFLLGFLDLRAEGAGLLCTYSDSASEVGSFYGFARDDDIAR